MAAPENRTRAYKRISDLEELLGEINGKLAGANASYLEDDDESLSKIFLMGPHRSGSTLFMQWLADSGLVCYPSNMLSRFYGAPLIGARIQQLLTDPQYNFRDEISDFNTGINFTSDNGKTSGALSPNEFWYFWRRFLPFSELDYATPDELESKGNLSGLVRELNALTRIFGKPIALKGIIMNQCIPALSKQFEKAIFVYIKRDPTFNIQSALKARKRQYGDIRTWYSFKIREYPTLKDLDPLDSAAGQIAAIHRSVESGLDNLPESNKLYVPYEDFCDRPEYYYNEIVTRLKKQNGIGSRSAGHYKGQASFENANIWTMTEYSEQEARSAYARFSNGDSPAPAK